MKIGRFVLKRSFGTARFSVVRYPRSRDRRRTNTHCRNRRRTSMSAATQTTQPDITPARPPLPPFIRETAAQKVRMAEDGWNSRDAGLYD
jgi:hypothetical protein